MHCCCSIDTALNYPGYVPALSSITGLFRMVLGVVEMVVGAIFSTLCCQSYEVARIMNGCLNVIRGAVETVPILGNVALLAYDFFC